MDTKVIYQGNDTGFGGGSLFVKLCTDLDLTGYTATLAIDGTDFTKSFTADEVMTKKLSFNISATESAAMPPGFHEASLRILDAQNNPCAVLCDTIFEVRRPQDADN